MSSAPSLALRSLLTGVIRETGLQSPIRRLSGASPPVRALAIAAASKRLSEGTVLMVLPTDAEIENAVGDICFFLGVLEGSADAVVSQQVLPFPSTQVDPYRGFQPHLKVASARARVLHALATGSARVVVASAAALLTKLPEPATVLLSSCEIKPGVDLDPHELANTLVMGGYEPADPVDAHGEFARRGGIFDVFPAGEELPIRIEFVGDTVESVRRFDPGTQRSVETLDRFGIVPVREAQPELLRGLAPLHANLFQFLRTRDAQIWLFEPTDVENHVKAGWEQIATSYADAVERHRGGTVPRPPNELLLSWEDLQNELATATIAEQLAIGGDAGATGATGALELSTQPTATFHGRIPDWIAAVKSAQSNGDDVVFVAGSHGRAERTVELLTDYDVRAVLASDAGDVVRGAVLVTEGWLSKGFRLRLSPGSSDPAMPALVIYAETDVFDEERRKTGAGKKRSASAAFLSDLRDLKVGDLIVHVDHGIGQFVGLKQISVASGDVVQEFLELRYHADAKLFVPVERLDLIQKYTGGSKPPLDRLGGTTWERAKTKVKKAMRDMAEELLKLYAARKAIPGHPFGQDTHWQEEFEDAFEFDLTPDQATAIAEIKRDMETPTPMDRLLCGDVGYGKTEVAMRAAFKAVMDGKQVAILVPTTVLAQQHYETFLQRLTAFPVIVEMLSRFRTPREQTSILHKLSKGEVDIVIGTHRLISSDVEFRDLGLVIIDEEQRFGVTHKEHLKKLRTEVDVLTLTATPIPRTLYMALTGVRDISNLNTPPEERLPIVTHVGPYSPKLVRQAILRELERGGQIFFVHNRVNTIDAMRMHLNQLVPEARVDIGHGQMPEQELASVMHRFNAGETDVLLSTTIIESGLDIPNANTLIVDRADTFGLAQLYQLRGRVGRGAARAYSYFFRHNKLSPTQDGQQRLEVIAENTQLGAGYSIAMRDLEIRGAGELLGTRQSGHIQAVGFHLYTRLLADAVRQIRRVEVSRENGKEKAESAKLALPLSIFQQPISMPVNVDLPLAVGIPADYIADQDLRLRLYRRIADLRDETEIDALASEFQDRFGELPEMAGNLFYQMRVKLRAERVGLSSINWESGQIVLRYPPLSDDRERRLPDLGPGIRGGRNAYWCAFGRDEDWQGQLLDVLERLERV